jgi:hypothetical protein
MKNDCMQEVNCLKDNWKDILNSHQGEILTWKILNEIGMYKPIKEVKACNKCSNTYYAKGLCRGHYQQVRYAGQIKIKAKKTE